MLSNRHRRTALLVSSVSIPLLLWVGCGVDGINMRGKTANKGSDQYSLKENQDQGSDSTVEGAATANQFVESQGANQNPVYIYILAGQSNALGPGFPNFQALPIDSDIDMYYRVLPGIRWIENNCPTDCNIATLPFTTGGLTKENIGPQANRAGAEITLARNLTRFHRETEPGARLAVIKYAIGGTALDTDWLGNNGKTHKIKDDFFHFVSNALTRIKNTNSTVRFGGVVWMQGENDSNNTNIAGNYLQNLETLMSELRRTTQFGLTPITIVATRNGINVNEEGLSKVRKAQKDFVDADPLARIVYGDSLPINPDDNMHYTRNGIDQLGIKVAKATATMLDSHKAYSRGLVNEAKSTVSAGDTTNLAQETFQGALADVDVRVLIPKQNVAYQAARWNETENPAVYIQREISRARVAHPQGQVKVIFPAPSIDYTFNAISGNAHLALANFNDMTLDFNNAHFVFSKVQNGIVLSNVHRFTLQNLKMKHGFSVAATGIVRESDTGEKTIEVDASYHAAMDQLLTLLPTGNFGDFVAGKSMAGPMPRISNPRSLEATPIRLGGITYSADDHKFHCKDADLCARAIPQDKDEEVVIINTKNRGNGLLLAGASSDVTVRNVEMSNIAGCAIFSVNFDRGLLLDRVNVHPESNSNFMGAGACGVRIRNGLGDYIVRDSSFVGLGDDGANFQGDTWSVVSSDVENDHLRIVLNSNGVKAIKVDEVGNVGDNFVITDDRFRPWLAGKIIRLSQSDTAGSNVVLKADVKSFYFDAATALPRAGTPLNFANLNRVTKRIYIKNSNFGRTRARGLLLQASHIMVSGGSMFGNARSGIMITSDLATFRESCGAFNITISGAKLENNNFWRPNDASAIGTYADLAVVTDLGRGKSFGEYPIFRGIKVEGNQLTGGTGSVMQFTSSNNVTVTNNTISNLRQRIVGAEKWGSQPFPEAKSITVINSRNVDIRIPSTSVDSTYEGIMWYPSH